MSTVSFNSHALFSELWIDAMIVDDCWSEKTGRVDGHIAVNKTRFPDGIDGLANKIHGLGLKFGIYSSRLA